MLFLLTILLRRWLWCCFCWPFWVDCSDVVSTGRSEAYVLMLFLLTILRRWFWCCFYWPFWCGGNGVVFYWPVWGSGSDVVSTDRSEAVVLMLFLLTILRRWLWRCFYWPFFWEDVLMLFILTVLRPWCWCCFCWPFLGTGSDVVSTDHSSEAVIQMLFLLTILRWWFWCCFC